MSETRKISIKVGDLGIEAYQSTEGLILLTHRQIAEIVGKSKAVVQRFFSLIEEDLPSTVKASIPERKGKIALTPWQSAMIFWHSQAEKGNNIAQDIITAIGETPEADLVIITNDSISEAEESNSSDDFAFVASDIQGDANKDSASSLPNLGNNGVKLIADGIEVASVWMVEAGIDERAIASWKLKELGKQIPALAGVVTSALETITNNSSSPTGMITSQLAEELSTKLGTKVTPAKVNQALHDLELQDWAKPGVNRERKLTDKGKEYGIALLTTSADGWQGAQLRWYDSVIPLLSNYFSQS